MKKNHFIFCIIFFIGCNFSDESIKLPGGHTYVNEGKCYKYILVNIKNGKNIESCVSQYKFNNSFITVCQVNEKACENDSINTIDKLFYIIDVKKEILYGPLSNTAFSDKLNELEVDKKLFLE